MESRDYKDDFKKIILDMAQKELESHASTKGAQKYFEGNIDKIINNSIKEMSNERSSNLVYSKVIKQGTKQENIISIAKIIKKEEIFKSKNGLVEFGRYLGLNVNIKGSYSQILKKISKHIYLNRKTYARKYVSYKRGSQEYVLEPEKIKTELVESYKSKTRNDMKSIAKLLSIQVNEEEGAEDIRKKVINYIIKEKLGKKDKQ